MAVQPFPSELKHLYTSAELIGSGGFARVFKARRKDGRVVAVKIPLSLDEATGRSFLREITSWQRLVHRNIVSLFDANILPIPYLELEYVEGGNLEDMEKPLETAQACEIVFDIAEGLKYAHKQGIVHRDLKPHNILLTKERIPKITDWGLSRVIAESKSSSQYSFSPVYAAPEQVSPKKFGKPDERTDIYQLGVIFYNLLTNELPFKGEDLTEIATAIALEAPILPSSLNPEAQEVEHIVLNCIAKRKEDRYQSVGELQRELAEFIKRDYKESLKLSLGAGDMKRSAFYCAELCLVHARLGDVKEALKFAFDLKNYAGGEAKRDMDTLAEGLKFRLEKGLGIDEELFNKMEVVLHQVKMGWGKLREKQEREALEKVRREEEERQKREERTRKEREEQERRLREQEERTRREREEQERLRREEAQKREKEKQEKLRREEEERKVRADAERQKARQEEERLRRQREEQEREAQKKEAERKRETQPQEEERLKGHIKKPSQSNSLKIFGVVMAVIGLVSLVYWTSTFALTVTVIDSETENQVSDASIYLDGNYIGITDFSGKLKTTRISKNEHTVKVKKDNYKDIEYNVWKNKNEITIYLEPLIITRTIIVTDSETNSYARDASVYLEGDYKSTTDSSGKVEVKLNPRNNPYTVAVKKNGYRTEHAELFSKYKGDIKISLSPFILRVYVIDPDPYIAISDASVYLDEDRYAGVTDSKGEIRITKLSEGYHTVKAAKSGYQMRKTEKVLFQDDVVEDAYVFLEKISPPPVTSIVLPPAR